MTKTKSFKVLLIVFVLMLITGIAFAALTGNLTWQGQTNFGEQVKLEVTLDSVGAGSSDSTGTCESKTTGVVATGTGDLVMDLIVNFVEPGDAVTFNFTVKNLSSFAVDLGVMSIGTISDTNANNYTAGDVTVNSSYKTEYASGTKLDEIGEDDDEISFDVVVTWVQDTLGVDGFVTFTITISYEVSAG